MRLVHTIPVVAAALLLSACSTTDTTADTPPPAAAGRSAAAPASTLVKVTATPTPQPPAAVDRSAAAPESTLVKVTATPTPTTTKAVTPAASPVTNNRGAIIKNVGEPFGVLRADDTKLIQMTVDSIQRITATECPNASNPYITINDPGEGFAILDLTVQTFTNPPTFPEPLSLWDWYTVDGSGRVTTGVGTDNSAMSCAMSDGQDMSNLMPNSTYSKRIIVPVSAGTEHVGYQWTNGVSSAQWEWALPQP